MILHRGVRRTVFFLLFFTFAVKTACYAQDSQTWYTPFFFEGAAHFYFDPDMFSDTVLPAPGFRGALGYEWRRLRFSVGSGYTRITGTNPMVLNVQYIPLTLRLGYEHPLPRNSFLRNISVRADAGYGLLFTEANIYATALDLYMDVPGNFSGKSHLAEGRLCVLYTLPGNFLRIYAGGGGCVLFEPTGPLFRGAFEAGLVFRPFVMGGKRRALPETEQTAEEIVILPDIPATEEAVPTGEETVPAVGEMVPEPIVLKENEVKQGDEKAPVRIENGRR